MKNFSHVRVRFAPSPTGFMHIGNVRCALLNALFAHQSKGTFVLRIEDTDQSRDIDPQGKQIIADLNWLNLAYQEGPFYQSQRAEIYQRYFDALYQKGFMYRCFETTEELEQKRQRQIARGLPPRYDRAGLKLSSTEIDELLGQGKPFIWRFKLPDSVITINDLAHGTVTFDLSNFSDFAVSRHDGSFTFIFANFVDDVEMAISHVIRGGDHLSNTALQAALYQASKAPMPTFYHLPLICNAEGKKLSKRDFGFSLDDLRTGGFLPEAICNYLGIIGGSFSQEILTFDELAQAISFEHISQASQIKYDVEKLRWVNHKWISTYDPKMLAHLATPLLQEAYPVVQHMSHERLTEIIARIQSEMVTLHDAIPLLAFIFNRPAPGKEKLAEYDAASTQGLFSELCKQTYPDSAALVEQLKTLTKRHNGQIKQVMSLTRLALTGSAKGMGIGELVELLGIEETIKRLNQLT